MNYDKYMRRNTLFITKLAGLAALLVDPYLGTSILIITSLSSELIQGTSLETCELGAAILTLTTLCMELLNGTN